MLCDFCHKNIATVHLTEIINDKVTEIHICQSCAKAKAEEIKDQLSISDFLAGLADVGEPALKKSDLTIKCKRCNLTYTDFKKKGRLGCADCYRYFRNMLLPLLRKIHGSDKHRGKKVFNVVETDERKIRIEELRKQLQLAIQLEEYEEAARLRDEIKKLEEKKDNKEKE